MTNEIFNDNPTETLVGDGKKYATQADLEKAYNHADRTIADRNRELAELREELATRLSVEEQLSKLNAAPRVDPSQRQETPPVVDQTPKFTNEDLVARIREELNQERQATRAQANADIVYAKLLEIYGTADKANEVVRNRATELGVSVKFLEDSAVASPNAFFAQIGILDKARTTTPTAPHSEVNREALGNSGGVKAGSYEYYEEIRKTDPKRYFTPKLQMQLMKDASDGVYVPK